MANKKGGAKTKLTDELEEQFCGLIQIGVSIEDACTACGIDESTYHKWRKKLELKQGTRLVQFFKSVAKARALSKVRCIQTMDRHANGSKPFYDKKTGELIRPAIESDWRAASWLLERRFPEEYGRADQVKVHNAKNGETFRPPGSHSALLDTLQRLDSENKDETGDENDNEE
jgi:transposase